MTTIQVSIISSRQRKLTRHMAGVEKEILAFRFIRNNRIDQHRIDVNTDIQAVSDSVIAYCLSKAIANASSRYSWSVIPIVKDDDSILICVENV